MSEIMNIIILMFFGFVFLFFHEVQIYSILPLLIVIILSSIVFMYPKKRGIALVYVCFCFFFPDFLYFLSCILYLLMIDRHFHVSYLFLLLPYVFMIDRINHIVLLLCGFPLAYILKVRYLENEILKNSYQRQRDTTKELAIVMEEKNKNLMLAQEQDMHIAILNERNRIAREIHDHVGHLLSSSLLQVGALQAINEQDALVEPLKNLRETISKGMDNVRNSVHDLHDDALDLKIVLDKLCDEFTFCKISLEYDIIHPFSHHVYYHVLAIIKEALHNIVKHSNATRVSLCLREQPAFYQLIIHDNGSMVNVKREGIGLTNMKERVEQMHGFFNLHTTEGFQIFITIPKEDIS